jgi:NADPH2:quinone reductase
MKAIRIERFGNPGDLKLREIQIPEPGRDEALVRIASAGINYIDVYMRNGSYARSHTYGTPLPMTLGMEGGGTIAALGAGVRDFALGDRVAYCLSRGSYAEYAAVPAWRLARVPDDVPLPIATALMLQGATAHYLAHSAFALGPGRTCLVHAGAGGVGQLLIQLAKRAGAGVIATVGSEEKAEIARHCGADHTILYRHVDFYQEVRRITGGVGVDVVYDSVGRDTLTRSMRSLKRRGLCISFGASSGQPEPVALLELAEAGSIFLTRPHLADYTSTAEEICMRAADLFAAYRSGALRVAIDTQYPLSEAARAHAAIEGRQTRGKLLLSIP